MKMKNENDHDNYELLQKKVGQEDDDKWRWNENVNSNPNDYPTIIPQDEATFDPERVTLLGWKVNVFRPNQTCFKREIRRWKKMKMMIMDLYKK